MQIGLVHAIGLDLGTTLLVTGLYNIASGVQFGIPMCVQPMKTIAAVAIAGAPALSIPQMAAAGGFVSACVVLLGGSGLVDLLDWLVPRCTVRGVQVAVGIKLAIKVSRSRNTSPHRPSGRCGWSVSLWPQVLTHLSCPAESLSTDIEHAGGV